MSAIDYSDGNVEKDIVNILKNTKNLSSDNSIASDQYDLWPIKYHLTSLRSNILRHLDFQGMDVLELGAGMGAVSRFIAENANHLTIVEGSEQRFEAASLRLGDLSNWDGVVSNYINFQTDKKYDVVCLIGVLEYAGRYIKTENPFQTALKHAKSFLKSNGVIVIALENKNGIKYFNGISEDHFAKPYFGVCGYQVKRDIETFSLYEMKKKLNNVGLINITTHFPWPDYKLPRVMITETMNNMDQQISANVASTTKFEDYQNKFEPLYPNWLALDSLAKSNMLDQMSNSFLFLACESTESEIKKKLLSKELVDNEIGWMYSDGRKFNVQTTFLKKNDCMTVRKEFCAGAVNKKENNFIIKSPENTKIISGQPVNLLLLNHAYYNNWKDFLKLYLQFFKSTFIKYRADNDNYLLPEAFDAISRNCILTKTGFEFFDLEFVPQLPFLKSHFVSRTILNFRQDNPKIFKGSPYKNLYSLYEILCSSLNVNLNLKEDLRLETEFLNTVLDLGSAYKSDDFYQIFFMDFHEEKKTFIAKIFSFLKLN